MPVNILKLIVHCTDLAKCHKFCLEGIIYVRMRLVNVVLIHYRFWHNGVYMVGHKKELLFSSEFALIVKCLPLRDSNEHIKKFSAQLFKVMSNLTRT